LAKQKICQLTTARRSPASHRWSCSSSFAGSDHLILEGDALLVVLVDLGLCNLLGRKDLQIFALIAKPDGHLITLYTDRVGDRPAMKRRSRLHRKRDWQLTPGGCGHRSAGPPLKRGAACLGDRAHNLNGSNGELLGYIYNLSGSERCTVTSVKASATVGGSCWSCPSSAGRGLAAIGRKNLAAQRCSCLL